MILKEFGKTLFKINSKKLLETKSQQSLELLEVNLNMVLDLGMSKMSWNQVSALLVLFL